eukprot:TRINITY_DN15631_c0_g1_i1.p1 TRINITY_DN15631_c0_g1~~TRINITY_DN15631_c0_g1_i1.p1  ORF type:complete len:913 (-),score=180.14 TRINITY_DN15631_c0_g1_i1:351-3050(-)
MEPSSALALSPTAVAATGFRYRSSPPLLRRGYAVSSSEAATAGCSGGSSGSGSRPWTHLEPSLAAVAFGLVASRRKQRAFLHPLRSQALAAPPANVLAESNGTDVALSRPKSVTDIVASGELEQLSRSDSGTRVTYSKLSQAECKNLQSTAQSMGLACQIGGPNRSAVTVYKSAEEILYGVVPYSFKELGVHKLLVQALLKWTPKAITQPTHIQASAIPKLLKGEDVAIQAETGSGKTFAYLLPAAQAAIERAYGADAKEEDDDEDDFGYGPDAHDLEDGTFESSPDDEPEKAVCYRVERTLGTKSTKLLEEPEEFAKPSGKRLRVGDEFMADRVAGSPLSIQFIKLADGRGWYPWKRSDMRLRFSLTATEYKRGQEVAAAQRLEYASGDVVEPGTKGTIVRLKPYIGVSWEGLKGIKAVILPGLHIRDRGQKTHHRNKWRRCAPDTLIITYNRELCEQVAEAARKLGSLLPDKVQEHWKVGVAVGPPPGVGKKLRCGREEWPFPLDSGKPDVVVTTLEFMGYFYHKKHIPLWAGIRYIVFDEVDYQVSGPLYPLLKRIKVMLLRAMRTEGERVQSALVSCTMPSQGGKSTRLLIANWMPHALRALPRPDLLHRNHPMVLMTWKYIPEGFDEKVEQLVEFLKSTVGFKRTRKKDAKKQLCEKTIVFVNSLETAAELAETLATGFKIAKVGIFVPKIGSDERRERMRMFRDGRIMLMVCTDVLARGIDIPDLKNVVQFDFARNIVDHINRTGRVSRAGSLGRAFNMYDEDKFGGRILAEAVQELGAAPLDALFSRRGGFRTGLKRTEQFRQMLLNQGLPLPKHLLQAPSFKSGPPVLPESAESQEDLEPPEFLGGDDEDEPNLLNEEEEIRQFEDQTDSDKDKAYQRALKAAMEEDEADF